MTRTGKCAPGSDVLGGQVKDWPALLKTDYLERRMNDMIGMLCEKCEELVGFPPLTTRLVGGVTANLCPGCVTKWNEHISHHSTFQRLRVLECVRSSIVSARELPVNSVDPELTVVLIELQECEDILHGEGLKWLGRED